MSWVPGDGTCAWGAISKAAVDCAADAVSLAVRLDTIDAPSGPTTGLVAVPVCSEHGHRSHEWDVLPDESAWLDAQELYDPRVWLVERETAR